MGKVDDAAGARASRPQSRAFAWRASPIKGLQEYASHHNQDLRDYRIFRIRPARVFDGQALIRIRLVGIYGYGEKRKLGEAKS